MEKARLAVLKILVGAFVAITPAVLTYCKASGETDESAREADAGYKALVESVKRLQDVVDAQGETLKLIVRERYGSLRMETGSVAAGSADMSGSAAGEMAAGAPFDPHFPELPSSNEAALQQQQAAKY